MNLYKIKIMKNNGAPSTFNDDEEVEEYVVAASFAEVEEQKSNVLTIMLIQPGIMVIN